MSTHFGHIPTQTFGRRRRVRPAVVNWPYVGWALLALSGFGSAAAIVIAGAL
jgi:hypothetical protein